MEYEKVLEYWFGEGHPDHFKSSSDVDAEIAKRFGGLMKKAMDGTLDAWVYEEKDPRKTLAFLILLDQFRRNVFRGTKEAFAGDGKACKAAVFGVEQGMDKVFPNDKRLFFFLPMMHAEDGEMQKMCLQCMEAMLKEAKEEGLDEKELKGLELGLEFAKNHSKVIERFGRYPHRNVALGRENTEEEEKYLKSAESWGQ